MQSLMNILALQLLACFAHAASSVYPSSVTVWTWPLASASPAPLATINYHPTDLNTSVTAYTPPKEIPSTPAPEPGSYDPKTLVRVGLYNPKIGTKSWSGSVTHITSFDPKHQHQISLSLSADGSPLSVSFNAFAEDIDPREERRRAKREERQRRREEEAKAKGKVPKSKAGRARKKDEKREQPIVEIVRQQEGPRPVLNKPVVLDSEGKVPEKEEKTFLQKYWWAIALFLVVQLLAAGGGGEGGK